LAPFTLGNTEVKDWHEFSEKDPHLAYAWVVARRYRSLDELVVSLRVVPQMMGVSTFPVKSDVRDMNRYDWFVSTLDLGLQRFSTARDCCAFLVREVFELDLRDHKTFVDTVSSHLGEQHPVVVYYSQYKAFSV